jgi:hypothetical protein
MNFNFSTDDSTNPEYELFRSTTEELINLYGIKIKYIITEKVNQDDIFGEHTHIKVDNEKVHEFFAKPEETDTWGGEGDLYSKFGLQNLDTMNIYVSRSDMEKVHPEIALREGRATIENLPHGNLVVFDSNKIMEVTDMKLSSDTFGNNNVFDSNLAKNVYKLSLKTYIANRDDYSAAEDISNSDEVEYEDFGNLESIFGSEEENREEQDHRAKDVLLEDEIIYPNELRSTAIREKEDSVFGDLG